jgi:glycosyltransferase involved in cell wall biosynthesis
VKAGYDVTLVGRKLRTSQQLEPKTFHQKRIFCFFTKGPMFYAEYNFRLFVWLLFQKADCLCAIDLDTILPCLWASQLKGIKRVYDAHELFCEMKEIVSRPSRYKIWKQLERYAVPKFSYGYTVCKPIADEFKNMYGVAYVVIRNVPVHIEESGEMKVDRWKMGIDSEEHSPFFIYQGAVNEGRSFETLIPAMKEAPLPLHIYGDGNFLKQVQELIRQFGVEDNVFLKGKLRPEELRTITSKAFAGITLFENNGQSNYLSLANRFFDYIQAGIPQLCVNYPSYREINGQQEVAVLIDDLKPETIVAGLNLLFNDTVTYKRLQFNCRQAAVIYNWSVEETKLISFYKSVFE